VDSNEDVSEVGLLSKRIMVEWGYTVGRISDLGLQLKYDAALFMDSFGENFPTD
jgi:hypothetical protein